MNGEFMGLIKLAGKYLSYRKVTNKEREAMLAQHKRWEGPTNAINTGMSGALGGLGGAAIGSKHGVGGAIAGGLVGAAGLGTIGHFASKIDNETREDRIKNPDRKWGIYEPSLRRVVKKYGK